jgi:hypothetical protein
MEDAPTHHMKQHLKDALTAAVIVLLFWIISVAFFSL